MTITVDEYKDHPLTPGADYTFWTQVQGLHFASDQMMTLDDLMPDLRAELDALAQPDVPEALGIAYNPARVWFRGGWTCECVVQSLPLVEAEMLRRGLIKQCIDLFQLGWNRGGVAASAGSHDRGMMVDTGQYSPAQLAVWWSFSWFMQHRTVAQGFAGDHGHGGPMGCPHGSTLALWQMQIYKQGRNGLRSNGPAEGPWETMPSWADAIKAKQAAQAKAQAATKQQAVSKAWSARLPISYSAFLRGVTGVERGKPTGNVLIVQDILGGKGYLKPGTYLPGVWDLPTQRAFDHWRGDAKFVRAPEGRVTWPMFAKLVADGGWRGVQR